MVKEGCLNRRSAKNPDKDLCEGLGASPKKAECALTQKGKKRKKGQVTLQSVAEERETHTKGLVVVRPKPWAQAI